MSTAAPSTALATIQPAFTGSERLALAGFLAGYRGLTREAYALDLRQFTTWCRARSLALFAVRRADIEGFARDLEERGRARADEIDAHAVDETIHHYHRAAGELWKFCFARGGGSHAEFIAGLLDRMTADAETIDWWERATPRPRQ